jgi:hypothetical protein
MPRTKATINEDGHDVVYEGVLVSDLETRRLLDCSKSRFPSTVSAISDRRRGVAGGEAR